MTLPLIDIAPLTPPHPLDTAYAAYRVTPGKTDQLYTLCYKMALQFAHTKLFGSDTAFDREGFAQDVTLSVFTGLTKLQPQTKFSGWFYKICRNKRADVLDARVSLREVALTDEEPITEEPDSCYTQLLEVLGTNNEPFVRLVAEGYTYSEAAHQLGIRPNAIIQRISYYKRKQGA